MRVHLSRIVTHSNRVTAVVALSQAGVPFDDIAFRLRWSPASVSCEGTSDDGGKSGAGDDAT